MPTAPTLNRPPKLPEAKSQTSTPPLSTPPGGNNPALMQAALSQSTKGNPGAAAAGTPPLQSGAGVSDPLAPPSSSSPLQTGRGVSDPLATANNKPPNTSDDKPGNPGDNKPGNPANNKPPGDPNAKPSPFQDTVNAPGAPPGVPDTSYTIPLLPQDEAVIQSANQDFSDQSAAANLGMGQAAFAYGDPTQMERFGVGIINPNSALAIAALRSQQQQEQATNQRGNAGTLFSGLALEDRQRIGATQQRADLLGNTRYQAALARFNGALETARTTRDRLIGGARADERAAAIKNLPTANTASGGFQSSTATGSKSIASKGGTGPKTASGTKPTRQKGTSTSVPTVGKPGKPSKTTPGSVHKPSTSTVKKPPKVAGRK